MGNRRQRLRARMLHPRTIRKLVSGEGSLNGRLTPGSACRGLPGSRLLLALPDGLQDICACGGGAGGTARGLWFALHQLKGDQASLFAWTPILCQTPAAVASGAASWSS